MRWLIPLLAALVALLTGCATGDDAVAQGGTFEFVAPGGKTLESHTDGKSEDGSYQESAVIGFDEATKMLSFVERRRDLQVASKGDWTSPVSIRFTVVPIKVKGQTLHLRRTIAVISAYSFTVTEELSEDGGPFVRLGQAIFSKPTYQHQPSKKRKVAMNEFHQIRIDWQSPGRLLKN